MASNYGAYKPLRNLLRGFHLSNSLEDVWRLWRHIVQGGLAPRRPGHPPYSVRESVYAWDLPVLARELLLNASTRGTQRLDTYSSVAKAVNLIRDVENAPRGDMSLEDAYTSLHRGAHRQFSWQGTNDGMDLLRYLKIFGSPSIEEIFLARIGLTVQHYYFLGLAIQGHLLNNPGMNVAQDYTSFGISQEQSLKFFMKLSKTGDQLKQELQQLQRYDEGWEGTWNPLIATPLVSLDPAHPHRLHCPVPTLMLRRFSQGIYYDLINAPGFSKALGDAFEEYVGEVLHVAFPGSSYRIQQPLPYLVAGQTHHGADWVLSGADGNLFLECKTKRMRLQAKEALEQADLAADIDVLAEAVVQLYKNYVEARLGKTNWEPNLNPSFLMVVTLEDWYLFAPLPQELLRSAVKAKLPAAGLEECLLDDAPYSVSSITELEVFAALAAEVGIADFFGGKSRDGYGSYMWAPYMSERYPGMKRTNMREVFWDEFKTVVPIAAFAGGNAEQSPGSSLKPK